jgi:transmembrane 9 superfamily protein 2/4
LGSGAQIAVTTFFAIVLSAVGILSPARRGSLMNALLLLYVLSGSLAGYISSRIYQAFQGTKRQLCTTVTALLVPGSAFATFLFFNVVFWILQSTASVPYFDVLIVATMWCCVSVPLVFVGAYLGNKVDPIEFPTVTSTIARAIPTPRRMHDPRVGLVLAGLLPFSALYVELFFIMANLWMNQFYYVFGFTLIVYLILLVMCAETTVFVVMSSCSQFRALIFQVIYFHPSQLPVFGLTLVITIRPTFF